MGSFADAIGSVERLLDWERLCTPMLVRTRAGMSWPASRPAVTGSAVIWATAASMNDCICDVPADEVARLAAAAFGAASA
jgi:hypothetical protein